MRPLNTNKVYSVKAKTNNTGDQLRGLRFKKCHHMFLDRSIYGVDVDLTGDVVIQFNAMNGGNMVQCDGSVYDVLIAGKTLRYINTEGRESQLFTEDDNAYFGEQLRCVVVDYGEYFMLQISGMGSFVGVEKFDSGWYLSVSSQSNAALFSIQ
ncbi:hypothetical protein BGZ99_000772 [Dissophora globulifera]|uniref:Uncharacterized protein n=1 Tax=Dissophora globulifera TaxID=979702 RepID=A0A9P6R481_9FUNG|nr:hypothetical protein BGZ99_000772 [Dissophora globulifera]